jgi:hypothetical protein
LQAQGFQRLFDWTSAYFYGWYLVTPRQQTSVQSPLAGVPLSVPDVYSIRPGVAYALQPRRGLSVSLGTRLDGIPKRDVVGGSDGFRRPGYSFYVDPGLAIARRHGIFTVNVPLRVHQNFERSLVDIEKGSPGGGDLARYLVLLGYGPAVLKVKSLKGHSAGRGKASCLVTLPLSATPPHWALRCTR